MTAEVAILNRSALALAADSAVTIRVGSAQKIYDSAEKIFELSRRQPIALMIYNSVEHVGVPLDVLIRRYREANTTVYETIQDAANAFLDHMKSFPHDEREEKQHFFVLVADKFEEIQKSLIRAFRETYALANGAKQPKFSFNERLTSLLTQLIADEEANKLNGFLENLTYDNFKARFGVAIREAVKATIKVTPVDNGTIDLFERYAFALLRSKSGSGILTGLVFGGFGSSDLFPSLYYVEIDGVYFGELKILESTLVDIDRGGERAAMVPFAQKDMADRFIFGIDEEFEGQLGKFVGSIVDQIAATKKRTFKANDIATIKTAVDAAYKKLIVSMREAENRNVLDIVNFMSKKELADMAHALVELTSKKRRFSTDLETVGGPIDVAIVTRNEGFIWIRRKHYFDPGVNPGYHARVFTSKRSHGDQSDDGEKAGTGA